MYFYQFIFICLLFRNTVGFSGANEYKGLHQLPLDITRQLLRKLCQQTAKSLAHLALPATDQKKPMVPNVVIYSVMGINIHGGLECAKPIFTSKIILNPGLNPGFLPVKYVRHTRKNMHRVAIIKIRTFNYH